MKPSARSIISSAHSSTASLRPKCSRRPSSGINNLCIASCLLSLTANACGPIDGQASTEPEAIGSTEQAVEVEFLAILDVVGKVYGAYQAGEFVYRLLAGAPEDEAIGALRNYHNGDLVGAATGLLSDVNEIMADPWSSVNQLRIPGVLNDANVLEGQMIAAINMGNPNDAHQLAPALNLFAPIHAQLLALAGGTPELTNAIFAKVLQADFQMIGAWSTSRNNPGLIWRTAERDAAVLWPVDGGWTNSLCPQDQIPGGVVSAINAYRNQHKLQFPFSPSPYLTCNASACFYSPNPTALSPTRQFYDAPACLPFATRHANQIFNRNPVVRLIEVSMAHIMSLGIQAVVASNGEVINVVDPIGREGGIALTGAAGWWSIPMGFSNGDGSFTETNWVFPGSDSFATFPVKASQFGRVPLTGDVGTATNATLGVTDGRSDILLAGIEPFISVAVSRGDGSFGDNSYSVSDPAFATWAARPGAKPLAGDFDRDGKIDIALVGGAGWTSIPISFAPSYAGTVVPGPVTNLSVPDFATWAQVSGARPVAGDFDGDRRTDIALVGGAGWASVPVAISNGNGSFRVTNSIFADFPTWAQVSGAKPVAGDFDGDGRSDIALVGGAGWTSVPVAFSNGDGSFRVTNSIFADFPTWAQVSGAKPVAGDFDGDGRTDIALIGGAGWWTVPVAFSNGDGSFRVTNQAAANLPSWATLDRVSALGGVFR